MVLFYNNPKTYPITFGSNKNIFLARLYYGYNKKISDFGWVICEQKVLPLTQINVKYDFIHEREGWFREDFSFSRIVFRKMNKGFVSFFWCIESTRMFRTLPTIFICSSYQIQKTIEEKKWETFVEWNDEIFVLRIVQLRA